MTVSGGNEDSRALVLSPVLGVLSAALTAAAAMQDAHSPWALGRLVTIESTERGPGVLLPLVLHPLIQLPGSLGVVGQILTCVALFWVVSGLERAAGPARTASFLVITTVTTAMLTMFVASRFDFWGVIEGADTVIIAGLTGYAWLHPDDALLGLRGVGARRGVVALSLVVVCVLLFGYDDNPLALTERSIALVTGMFAWRVDLGLGLLFRRLRGASASSGETGRQTTAALRARLSAVLDVLAPVLHARWRALAQGVSSELARPSLAPPPPPAGPAPRQRGYWDEIDPELPLARVDPLQNERS